MIDPRAIIDELVDAGKVTGWFGSKSEYFRRKQTLALTAALNGERTWSLSQVEKYCQALKELGWDYPALRKFTGQLGFALLQHKVVKEPNAFKVPKGKYYLLTETRQTGNRVRLLK